MSNAGHCTHQLQIAVSQLITEEPSPHKTIHMSILQLTGD